MGGVVLIGAIAAGVIFYLKPKAAGGYAEAPAEEGQEQEQE